MFKRPLTAFVAICFAAGVMAAPQPLRADEHKEYLVKAAFIYNFVKFVEWPGAKAIQQQSKIDICVLGDSDLAAAKEVFRAASTARQTLSIVQEPDAKNITKHCHIVFIGKSENAQIGEIMTLLKGSPVLTVSDIDGFAESGGMIGFVTSDNKVKVEVNTKAASAAGLRVDAQLLEIAVKVVDR